MFNDLARRRRVEDQEGQEDQVLAACPFIKVEKPISRLFFLLLPQVRLVLRIVRCPLSAVAPLPQVAKLPIISLMKRKTLLIIA